VCCSELRRSLTVYPPELIRLWLPFWHITLHCLRCSRPVTPWSASIPVSSSISRTRSLPVWLAALPGLLVGPVIRVGDLVTGGRTVEILLTVCSRSSITWQRVGYIRPRIVPRLVCSGPQHREEPLIRTFYSYIPPAYIVVSLVIGYTKSIDRPSYGIRRGCGTGIQTVIAPLFLLFLSFASSWSPFHPFDDHRSRS